MPGLGYLFLLGYVVLVFFGFVTASVLAMALIDFLARRIMELLVDLGKRSPRWLAFSNPSKPIYRGLKLLIWCFAVPAMATFAWFYRSASQTADSEMSFASIVGVQQPASAKVDRIDRTGVFDTSYWIHFTCSSSDLRKILDTGKYGRDSPRLMRGKDFDLHFLNPPSWIKLQDSNAVWMKYDQNLPGDPDQQPNPQGRTLVIRSDGKEVYGWANDSF